MAVLTNFADKRKIYIGIGALISLTTTILPLAIVLSNSKPVLVDLQLSERPLEYFKVEQIQNGIRIKVDDSVSHKYLIKNVFVPSGVASERKVAIQGDESAILNIVYLDGKAKVYIYDIAEAEHLDEVDFFIQDDEHWLLSAMGVILPLAYGEIEYKNRLPFVDVQIGNGYINPSSYVLVHTFDGVYFDFNTNLTSRILVGNVKIGDKVVPLAPGVRMRSIHLSNHNVITIADLYDDHYKVVYSDRLNGYNMLPSAISRALEVSPTSKVLSIEGFFRGYAETIGEDINAPLRGYFNLVTLDFADQKTYGDFSVLAIDDYFYVFSKLTVDNIGKVMVGTKTIASMDPLSFPRTLLLKKIGDDWYMMVIDSYNSLPVVSRGFVRISESNHVDDFIKFFNAGKSDKINSQIAPLTQGVKNVSFVGGNHVVAPTNLQRLYESTTLNLPGETLKLVDRIDIDLALDVLPEDVFLFPGNIALLTSMTISEEFKYTIIGRVQWGDFAIEANRSSVMRTVVVMRFAIGYAFFAVDFDADMTVSVSTIYQVPSIPKWLGYLPILDVITLDEAIHNALLTVRPVHDHLLNMKFNVPYEPYTPPAKQTQKFQYRPISRMGPSKPVQQKAKPVQNAKPVQQNAKSVPQKQAVPKKVQGVANKANLKKADAFPQAIPLPAPVAKNNKAPTPVRYITVDIKSEFLDRSIESKTSGTTMYLRPVRNNDFKYVIERITFGQNNVAYSNFDKSDIFIECMYVNEEFFVRIYKEGSAANTAVVQVAALRFMKVVPKWYRIN